MRRPDVPRLAIEVEPDIARPGDGVRWILLRRVPVEAAIPAVSPERRQAQEELRPLPGPA
jgi:hypothetical protein